jgi:V-type H+-transporting ATPase subunit H
MMLRIDQYRIAFVALDGIGAIITVLSGKVNFQIQYQLSFCLWVMTFNNTIAEKVNKFGVIPILADILADAQKEKVSRIILAVFRVSFKTLLKCQLSQNVVVFLEPH